MSAFVCNDFHVTVLAAYVIRHNLCPRLPTVDAVGELLHAENVRSVNYRYGDKIESDFQVDHRGLYVSLPAVEILKAARCLRYQSCEHPEYSESEARNVVEKILEHATGCLPGYDQAPWELVPKTTSQSPHFRQQPTLRPGK